MQTSRAWNCRTRCGPRSTRCPNGFHICGHPPHPPLTELIEEFVGGGGQVWACESCTKPRGITEVVDGADIRGALTVVEYLASGAQSLSF